MFLGISFLIKVFLYGLIGYFLWRYFQGRREKNNFPRDPLAIIQERYARGEISREEYYRLKGDLEQDRR